jgi:uncharacterized membrane protein YeaQ/YmgE (transglycosylase-associated protein family)
MEETMNTAFDLAAHLGTLAPWLIGIIGAFVVTFFLLRLGHWEKTIPWQIRAFTRVLIVIVFVYLLQMGAIMFIPEEYAERIKIFSEGIGLVGDIFKTFIGALIGALSMSMKEVYDDDDQNPANNNPPAP